MRQQTNARQIEVKKEDLISKIKANKENHIKEYNEAVEAYKIEAKKQLKNQLKELANGSLSVKVQLTSPVNQAEEYDKLITMFGWEIKDEVVLSQGEFNEYVLDETSFSIQAKFANSFYSSSNVAGRAKG